MTWYRGLWIIGNVFQALRVCTETLKVTNLSLGMFLASSLTSMVMSADHPGLTFSLSLTRSEPTYNQPVQQWSFVSDFAVKPQPSLRLLVPHSVS